MILFCLLNATLKHNTVSLVAVLYHVWGVTGWDKSTPDPEGGVIDRADDGQLTGCIRENALSAAELLVTWTKEEQLEHIRTGLDFCLRQGVTSVHSNEPGLWQEYCSLARQLPIRVFLSVYYNRQESGNFPDGPQKYSEMLSCDRVKLFTDGSLGACTAALSKPYIGTNSKGILMYSQVDFYTS